MNDEQYFQLYQISNSDLSLIKQSFAHYREKKNKPVTEAMIFGKAFDQFLLREEEFHKNFVIAPAEMDRRTNAGKQTYQALVESGRDILNGKQWTYLNQMRRNCFEHPVIANIIKESENEGVYFGILEDVEVRCKIDTFNKGWVFDFKTCQSATKEDFKRDSASRQYHRQLAFYMDILKQNIEGVQGAGIIPVEKPTESNYIPQGCGVNVFRFSDEALEVGRFEYRKLLNKYKKHTENTNLYMGYEIEERPLGLPIWAMSAEIDS